jgi:hypothetical protein
MQPSSFSDQQIKNTMQFISSFKHPYKKREKGNVYRNNKNAAREVAPALGTLNILFQPIKNVVSTLLAPGLPGP